MPRYVAFLRGINVGGHRVKMDRLRDLLEELGFADVSTFIASGNVTFSASGADTCELTDSIEGHLAERLGYDVATFLRSPDELEAITAFEPEKVGATATSGQSLYVVLLREPASEALRATLNGLASEMDKFRFAGREIYWLIQGKLTESPLFGKELDRALRGVPTTARNMTTMRRLVTKLAEQGDSP